MRRDDFEKNILNYLEDTLSPAERAEFELALEQNETLRALLAEYQQVISLEQSLQGIQALPHPSFSAKVLESIDTDAGFFKGRIMELVRRKHLLALTASTACLALCFGLLIRNQGLIGKQKFESITPDASILEPVNKAPAELDQAGSTQALSAPENEATRDIAILEEQISNPKKVTPYNDTRGTSLPTEGRKPQSQSSEKSATEVPAQSSVSPSDERVYLSIPTVDLSGRVAEQKSRSESYTMKDSVRSRDLDGAVQGKRKTSADLAFQEPAPAAAPPALRRQVAKEESNYGNSTGLAEKGSALADTSPEDKEFVINPSAPGYRPHPVQTAVSGERYTAWEENQPKLVSQEPLSTFSIDVDTGSYTNARRFLMQGTLPPADSVRIEEFVNYFSYDYAAPNNAPFALQYEVAPSPLEQDRYLVKLGLKARAAVNTEKPWNLVFLIDVSGSMSAPDKLGLVQQALGELVRNMKSEDRVSIVTYAGQSGVLLNATSVKHRESIVKAIHSLGAGGSTHGSAGIHDAYRIAQENLIKDGVNRVVLLTDGDFNVGTTGTADLIRLIEEKRQSGITLTTIGVGTGNYNESMMEQLADKGNGNYFYLDTLNEAKKVFGSDLASNMDVVAKDVKIQIEFNPAVVAQYRLIGYDNRRLNKDDFNNDRIDAGEVGAGHTVTALYEIVLKDSPLGTQLSEKLRYQEQNKEANIAENTTSAAKELAFFKLRYKEPTESRSKLLTFPLEVAEIKNSVAATSNDFRFAAAVSYFASKLRHSTFAGNYSYAEIRELASSATGSDEKGYRKEFINLVEKAQH